MLFLYRADYIWTRAAHLWRSAPCRPAQLASQLCQLASCPSPTSYASDLGLLGQQSQLAGQLRSPRHPHAALRAAPSFGGNR